MKILVDSKVRVRIKDLPKNLVVRIQKDLSFDNPDYAYQERIGNARALRYTQRYIYGFRKLGKYLVIDRAYLNILVRYLKHLHIEYTIETNFNTHNTDLFDDIKPIALRDYQQEAQHSLSKYSNGLIIMPCGSGKTITLLSVILRKKQWTLIIVHTVDLLNQWKEYINSFLGISCGEIRADVVDIQPITIATIQTLSKRVLTNKFLKMWGCIVLDEAHHSPAETFTEVMNQFPAKYRYGATATVHRSDKLEGMLFTVCGFPRYRINIDELEKRGFVIKPHVEIIETNYFGSRRSTNYNSVVTHLIRNSDRQRLILDTIESNQNHYNLVLSNRIEHLQHLYDEYVKVDDRCALLTGNVHSKQRTEIIKDMRKGKLHTIFATQLADEGLDIPILDRVYLTVSTRSLGRIEQRIGRIQRPFHNKQDAIVYDFCDSFIPMFERHSRERIHFYNALGLEVKGARTYGYKERTHTPIPNRRKDKRSSIFEREVARFTYPGNR
jgi:superfamily II DNA or RNA helicase